LENPIINGKNPGYGHPGFGGPGFPGGYGMGGYGGHPGYGGYGGYGGAGYGHPYGKQYSYSKSPTRKSVN